MATILILGISLLLIYGSAIVWCIRSRRKLIRRPQAKVIKFTKEVENALSLDFEIIQSC
jgi:hypothetical protein